MRTVTASLILTALLSLAVLTSCGGADNNNNSANALLANKNRSSSANARTNVEELGMLVNVPYESEEAFWKEEVSGKRLVAVLRFPESEARRLVADAEKYGAGQPVAITTESWFPPELVAQSDASGNDALSGHAYSARAFLQPPYNDGRITRIQDTEYFVLEVSAK